MKDEKHWSIYIINHFLYKYFCTSRIGTTTPNSNTALDIESTTGGFLFPRLTTAQRDLIEDNDPTTIPPLDLLSGTMIFNTDENNFQYWDNDEGVWKTVSTPTGGDIGNEGVVVMDFPTPITVGLEAGLIEYITVRGNVTEEDITNGTVTVFTNETRDITIRNDFGNQRQFQFDESDFDFNTDSTSWPENAPSETKDAIWDEDENTLIENPEVGQVHMWRVTFQYQKASKDTTVQFTLRNDLNDFEVNAQHRASEVDLGGSNRYKAFLLLLTIADENSLPGSIISGGIGEGYQLLVRANGEIDVELTKITRISFFKD